MSPCQLPCRRCASKTQRRKGIVGADVGDSAQENVSTTGRHAQRSDIVDNPRSAPENRRSVAARATASEPRLIEEFARTCAYGNIAGTAAGRPAVSAVAQYGACRTRRSVPTRDFPIRCSSRAELLRRSRNVTRVSVRLNRCQSRRDPTSFRFLSHTGWWPLQIVGVPGCHRHSARCGCTCQWEATRPRSYTGTTSSSGLEWGLSPACLG
jgi:hypothetical protein